MKKIFVCVLLWLIFCTCSAYADFSDTGPISQIYIIGDGNVAVQINNAFYTFDGSTVQGKQYYALSLIAVTMAKPIYVRASGTYDPTTSHQVIYITLTP